MTLTLRQIAIVAGCVLAALVVAFLGGRRSAPVRVEERERIVTQTVVDQAAIQRAVSEAHAEWTRSATDHSTIRTVYLDGKVVEKIVYVDRDVNSGGSSGSSSNTATQVETRTVTNTITETEKVTEFRRASWRISASAGWRLDSLALRPAIYGGEVSRRILGPVWLGAWAKTDSTAGMSLGLEF